MGGAGGWVGGAHLRFEQWRISFLEQWNVEQSLSTQVGRVGVAGRGKVGGLQRIVEEWRTELCPTVWLGTMEWTSKVGGQWSSEQWSGQCVGRGNGVWWGGWGPTDV